MAAVDGFFTARLKAHIHEPQFAVSVAAPQDSDESKPAVSPDVALVDAALNARYMQWGAVGVMMAMFVWNETKRQPARDKRFSEERREDQNAYLKSLETRDTQYLTALDGIRQSVERHVQQFIEAKDRQTEAFHDLVGEIRSAGK